MKSCMLFWLSASFLFGVDRYTKQLATAHLEPEERVTGIAGWYDWVLHYNPGATGGVFSGQSPLLILISSIAVLILIGFALRGGTNGSLWLMLGLGLMLGGTLGNLFDRILVGAVIDFIQPIGDNVIYNLADKGIRWGLFLSLFGLWRSQRALPSEEIKL